jgi:hypothetical protein
MHDGYVSSSRFLLQVTLPQELPDDDRQSIWSLFEENMYHLWVEHFCFMMVVLDDGSRGGLMSL